MRFLLFSFLCGVLAAPAAFNVPVNTTNSVPEAGTSLGVPALTTDNVGSLRLPFTPKTGKSPCSSLSSSEECSAQSELIYRLAAVKRDATDTNKHATTVKSSGEISPAHSKGKGITKSSQGKSTAHGKGKDTPKSSSKKRPAETEGKEAPAKKPKTATSPKSSVDGSSSSKRVPYVIWPKKGTSVAAQKRFTATLKNLVKKQMLRPTPALEGDGVMFWRALLTADEIHDLEKDVVVRLINLDPVLDSSKQTGKAKPTKHTTKHKATSSHQSGRTASKPLKATKSTKKQPGKRTVPLDAQATQMHNAPWELAELSLDFYASETDQKAYAYHKSGGHGVMVYGIDSGLDQSHKWVKLWLDTPPLLGGRKPQLHWIHTTEDDSEREVADDDSDSGVGHGSCVWSKSVGILGSAPFADYTVVKMDKTPAYDYVNGVLEFVGPAVTQATGVLGFVLAYRDIKRRKEQAGGNLVTAAPSVINYSNGGHSTVLRHNPELVTTMGETLKSLSKIGVSVFKAVPNGYGKPIDIVDDWWMTFREQKYDNFFTVASVNKHGQHSAHTAVNGPGQNLIDFHAPGEGLTCINTKGFNSVRDNAFGNSLATPLVTGLAAYAMGLPNGPRTPQQVYHWLTENAKDRDLTSVPALLVAGNQYARAWHEPMSV